MSRHRRVGRKTHKVHLDGDNLVPYLTGLRYDNWKLVFMEQRVQGTLRIWAEPFDSLRLPKMFKLRTDPYERADIASNTYYDWIMGHASCGWPLHLRARQ